MDLASTSRAQLRYVVESTFGTTPATTSTNLRMTGESLKYNIGTQASKEIRSDRQVVDLQRVSASAGGAFNFDLSYKEYDPFLEAVLQGTWAPYGTSGVGAVTATFTSSTVLTASAGDTGNNAFTNLSVGQWVKLSGCTAPANNGYHRITAKGTHTLTFGASTFVVEGTTSQSGDVTISSSRLANGTTQRSFTLEVGYADVSQFFAYKGMTAGKLNLSLQSGNMVSGSFDFMGASGARAGATTLTGTPAASQTGEVMNAITGVGSIMEGGSALTSTYIKTLSMGLDNKLRARDAIGNFGTVSIGSGTIELKGSMVVYLADGTLYDKFVNNTETSLMFRMVDDSGNGYIVTLPHVEYSDAQVNAGSADQDAMLTLPYEAVMDSTTGLTIMIDKVGAA